MPAGTGVCVVNTLPAVNTSRASVNESPCSFIRMRIRSSARNAACPSFMWHTSGLMPSVFKSPYAADTQQDFLADAGLPVAAIELRGYIPVFRPVLPDIGIKQVQGNRADLRFPDARTHRRHPDIQSRS